MVIEIHSSFYFSILGTSCGLLWFFVQLEKPFQIHIMLFTYVKCFITLWSLWLYSDLIGNATKSMQQVRQNLWFTTESDFLEKSKNKIIFTVAVKKINKLGINYYDKRCSNNLGTQNQQIGHCTWLTQLFQRYNHSFSIVLLFFLYYLKLKGFT